MAPEGSGDFVVHITEANTIDVIETAGSYVAATVQVSANGDVLLDGTYQSLNLAGTSYDVPSNGSGAGAFLALREASGAWHVHQPWSRHHEVSWQTATFDADGDLVLLGWARSEATDPTLFGHEIQAGDSHELLRMSIQDGIQSQTALPDFLTSIGVPSRLWIRDEAMFGQLRTSAYGGAIARLDEGHQWIATVNPRVGHNLFELHADPSPDGRMAVSVWVGNSQQPYINGALTWTSASGAIQELETVQVWQDWQSAWLTADGEFEAVDSVGGRGMAAHPVDGAWHPYIPNGGAYGSTVAVHEWCRLGTGGTDCTDLAHDWAKIGPDGTVWAWSQNYDVISLEIRRP